MINKIIFLFVTPAVEGDENKYSLTKLSDLGYQIFIYDLSPYIAPEVDAQITKKRIHVNNILYKRINSKTELRNMIKKNQKDSFFLPMFDDYYKVREVYKLFTKYDIRFGYVNNLVYELNINDKKMFDGANEKVNKDKIRSVTYNRLFRKVLPYKNAEFIAFGSELSKQSVKKRCRVDKGTEELYLHTFDYQRFWDSSPFHDLNNEYCVFLDQYIPYHPDNIKDRGLSIEPKKYYAEICRIIDAVADRFGMSVVIAAHPRADYTNKGVFPASYRIEAGKTSELIKGAKLVLAHFSTAIGFAALAGVPLSIILPPSISIVSEFNNTCKAFADLFGCTVIRNPFEVDNVSLNVDKDKYTSFIENYMTCKSAKGQDSLWVSISKYLEQ